MVASANSDVYTPFTQPIMLEEGPQSSEEGSGLHSPIFGPPFPQPHGDSSLRYHPDHLDIQNAAGILASQFDYNGLSLPVQPGPLLDSTLDIHSTHHHSYPSEFPLPPRSHLGLDIPHQSHSNTRLPPPPTHGGPVNLTYHSSSQRRYSGDPLHESPYSSSGGNVSGMPVDGDHRSSLSSSRRESVSQHATNASQEQPRREISNHVIACRQCRARKIRCDSTRPVCNNCTRRNNECQYDAVPKRRGPDKRPGTRQRSCKKRPADGSEPPPPPSKRKRTASGRGNDSTGPTSSSIKEEMGNETLSHSRPSSDSNGQVRLHQSSLSPQAVNFSPSAHPRALSGEGILSTHSDHSDSRDKSCIPPTPSSQYSRKVWWDELVNSYSATRDQSLKDIAADLSSLFSSTAYWLSFVNVPDFVRSLYNPEDRSLMQPSLVLSGLALSTLMKSSEMELGATGRSRALWLRDAAQSSLESSWTSGWIDMTLAKAALILALFESSSHPQHSPARARSSLVLLDNIIRALSLTFVDANEPDVSTFTPNTVPVANQRSSLDPISKEGARASQMNTRKCSCIPLPPDSSLPSDHFSSSWSYTPPWDPAWSPDEMHREACRRLCWSALNLVSSYTSHSLAFRKEPTEFFLTDPANFRLLFPGEVSERAASNHKSLSPKNSVWALYCRSMLLWSFCTRLRKDTYTNEQKAEFALEAWSETHAIQDALDAHVCNLDTALLYMCREYVYNTQMTITQTLRRLVPPSNVGSTPAFNHKHAEEWLYYQAQVINRVKTSISHLGEAEGHLLTRRPFQVTWFASQVAICLSLWDNDRSLINALELAKSILIPVDVLNSLWPCSLQQSRCDELRKRLSEACSSVQISLPLPPSYSLPPLVRAG